MAFKTFGPVIANLNTRFRSVRAPNGFMTEENREFIDEICDGADVTEEEAQHLKNVFQEMYPCVTKYLQEAGEKSMMLLWPVWPAVALLVPSFLLLAAAGFYNASHHWTLSTQHEVAA